MTGQMIIDAIKSGLGLIGDLAQEFLEGFTTLIYVAPTGSGTGSLTTFGIFAFVMLGVSVSFAVVKLCLNLLRSSTGA